MEQAALAQLWNPNIPNVMPDAQSPQMAQLRQTNLVVYNCPSDLNRYDVMQPASGPGGQNGYVWRAGRLYEPDRHVARLGRRPQLGRRLERAGGLADGQQGRVARADLWRR
jgi:hypothetical protein